MTRARSRLIATLLPSLALVAGCADDAVSPLVVIAEVRIDSISAVPGNVLARRVHATTRGADSVWVEITGADGETQRTPAVEARDGRNLLLVLGLRQGQDHTVRVVARSRAGRSTTSGARSALADSVPEPLRSLRLTTAGTPSAGYTMFPITLDSTAYIVIFDAAGDVRWYFDASGIIPNASVSDIQQLRGSGGFLAYVGLTSGWQPVAGRFQHILPDGRILGAIGAPAPFYTDNHAIVPLYFGKTLVATVLFGYDLRTIDMTASGGPPDARIAGHYIFRQRLGESPEFFWSGWDHLALSDWIEEPLWLKTWPNIDFDHPNALAIDRDGNYLVSWRHLGEITKIDSRSGAILWRWGGVHNQFTMVGDTLGFFSGQHSIQVLPNGNYLLYDNGLRHTPPESRAVEYRVDPVARTATLVWQYRHQPAIYTPFTGSVQRLPNGNTLVGWAGAARATEVTATGAVLWEGALAFRTPLSTYRVFRIPNLYRADEP